MPDEESGDVGVEAPSPPEAFPDLSFDSESMDKEADKKPSALGGVADIGVNAVVYVHEFAAKATGWPGWRVSDPEKPAWKNLFEYVFRRFPKHDWGLIISIMFILMFESFKVYGFSQWRDEQKNRAPKNAAPDANPARPEIPDGVFYENRGVPP